MSIEISFRGKIQLYDVRKRKRVRLPHPDYAA